MITAALSISTAAAQSTVLDDHIPLFSADITVEQNGDVIVTEEIDFLVSRGSRKRGIYRDFPTRYLSEMGLNRRVDFDVLSVTRNGRTEPFALEDFHAGSRVRIGDADIYLREGVHRYRLTYRTDRQLLFLKDADELYWNVTGNDWAHTINRAEARIRLPADAEPIDIAGYTGYKGETGQDFSQRRLADGSVLFSTTDPLYAGEGLTVAVSWPKGFVSAPSPSTRFVTTVVDNPGLVIGLIGLAVTFAYFYGQWRKVGRDPEKGTVIPRFSAPEDLSPAATGFVWSLPRSRKLGSIHAFIVALTSLAIKGRLTIEEREDGSFVLAALPRPAKAKKLPPGEAAIMKRLFVGRNREVVLERRYKPGIGSAVLALTEVLHREYEGIYFRKNTRFWIGGSLLALFSIVATLTAQYGDLFFLVIAAFAAPFVFGFLIPVIIGVRQFLGTVLIVGRLSIVELLKSLVGILIFLPFGIAPAGAFYLTYVQFGPATLILVCGMVALVFLFWHLLKAPTRQGQEILDQIEGYRLYLSVAEGERLKVLATEPEMTPEAFEHHLPYAMALGVEKEWADRFAAVADAAAIQQVAQAPRWYRTQSPSLGMSTIAASLSGTLSSTLTSASTAPSSSGSSGSSGGGSSGGGGGGGGGGSW